MIIICVNCDKKFNVNSDLIPSEGRTIQCGSCNHVWFFNRNDQRIIDNPVSSVKNLPKKKPSNPVKKQKNFSEKKFTSNNRGSEIIKYQPKSNFTFGKFMSYIFVILISFIGLIILIDTFKSLLYEYFPNLEFLLFSLYETLKDIELFIKDLI